MAKNNFYGVKVGLVPGIYETWDACKEVTDKYPGAKFEGFKTRAEAEVYVYGKELPPIEKYTVKESIQAAYDIFSEDLNSIAEVTEDSIIGEAVNDMLDILSVSDCTQDEEEQIINRLKKLLADTAQFKESSAKIFD